MNTMAPSGLSVTATAPHGLRNVLRSGAVLVAALGLTMVVLVALSSVVDRWA